MTLRVGTSGWQYSSWRPAFYPAHLATIHWLEYYAERFATVEVNNTFYRLPEAATFDDWSRCTPEGFVLAVKASRFLTHVKRLREPHEPIALLLERARGLGPKLGPVLLQLPPTLAVDVGRLESALDAFPAGVRVAVEFRHASWHVPEVYDLLATRDASLCLVDRLSRAGPVVRTAGWAYLRFHEGRAAPHPCYGIRSLTSWVERLVEQWGPSPDGYVYFNNDGRACALRNAGQFAALAERRGVDVTRVPRPVRTV